MKSTSKGIRHNAVAYKKRADTRTKKKNEAHDEKKRTQTEKRIITNESAFFVLYVSANGISFLRQRGVS